MSFERAPRPRRTLAGALAFAFAALTATCGWSEPHRAEPPADGAATMPEFELATVAGGRADGADFAGRVVLYEFWATWCTPCHVQVEILKQLYPGARAAGAEFVAVASGEPAEIVRAYAAEKPTPYPSLLDPDETLATALEVLGLPTLVLVDREGRIVWRQTGLTDTETLRRALERVGVSLAD